VKEQINQSTFANILAKHDTVFIFSIIAGYKRNLAGSCNFPTDTENFEQNSVKQLQLNFSQRRLWVLRISILPHNFPQNVGF